MLDGPFSDCGNCMRANPGDANPVRARWHCGYMDRLYWIGEKPQPIPRFGGQEYEADICPGYCVTLESVDDGARAYAWFQKSQLEAAFPNPPAKVIEACEVAMQAWNTYEAEQRALASGGG